MDIVIEFVNQNELLVMTSLLVLIIILSMIVFVIDLVNRSKNKKRARSLLNEQKEDMSQALKEELIEEESLEYTEDLTQYDDVLVIKDEDSQLNEIKYVEEDEELEKTKAQIELKNLKEELLKAEVLEKNNLPEPIVTKTPEPVDTPLDLFENKQEEDAIISLEEFSKLGVKKYEENEITQYQDDGNEPISIEELEKLYQKKVPAGLLEAELIEEKKEEEEVYSPPLTSLEQTNFKNSPVISPVFGIDESDADLANMKLEATANLDKLSEEIRKTNEFLMALKELKKNLP